MNLLDGERVLNKVEDDDNTVHWVCHCTNDNTSACGLDVSDGNMLDSTPDILGDECLLCVLAWPPGPTCPWGCTCSECGVFV